MQLINKLKNKLFWLCVCTMMYLLLFRPDLIIGGLPK